MKLTERTNKSKFLSKITITATLQITMDTVKESAFLQTSKPMFYVQLGQIKPSLFYCRHRLPFQLPFPFKNVGVARDRQQPNG